MLSAITICLTPEIRNGPFVLSGDLATACIRAAALGYDAVEILPPSAEHLNARELQTLLLRHGLRLAAIDASAGWFLHRLSLTDAEGGVRLRARHFLNALIDLAAAFEAPTIIGSMLGPASDETTNGTARGWLAEALEQLGPRAHAAGVPLLLEPLNRYETKVVNTLADATALLDSLLTRNVKLCCDLFHMNIEESSLSLALRNAAPYVGHVQFAENNRRAPGFGQMNFGAVAVALGEIDYGGYASVAAFPHPCADAAGYQALATLRKHFLLSLYQYPA